MINNKKQKPLCECIVAFLSPTTFEKEFVFEINFFSRKYIKQLRVLYQKWWGIDKTSKICYKTMLKYICKGSPTIIPSLLLRERLGESPTINPLSFLIPKGSLWEESLPAGRQGLGWGNYNSVFPSPLTKRWLKRSPVILSKAKKNLFFPALRRTTTVLWKYITPSP